MPRDHPDHGSANLHRSRGRSRRKRLRVITYTALGKNGPDSGHDESMNILLLGSDSRAGTHGEYGTGVTGARSDTAMVLHVDMSHKMASVVSIPRDTMVDRPR